jgi:hypothetical protein
MRLTLVKLAFSHFVERCGSAHAPKQEASICASRCPRMNSAPQKLQIQPGTALPACHTILFLNQIGGVDASCHWKSDTFEAAPLDLEGTLAYLAWEARHLFALTGQT